MMVNGAIVGLALCLPESPARAGDARVWILSGLEEKKPDRIFLAYAVPESDDIFGAFSCRPHNGSVTIFFSETSQKLKPGKSATAVLFVGETRASVPGKLTPNEEAGVPSFEGRIPADDPIFAAMASGEKLVATVGPSKQTAPLKGAAEKFRKFAAACAKP